MMIELEPVWHGAHWRTFPAPQMGTALSVPRPSVSRRVQGHASTRQDTSKQRTWDRVVAVLPRAGDGVKANRIAVDARVSRSTVRETLKMLVTRGIVERLGSIGRPRYRRVGRA